MLHEFAPLTFDNSYQAILAGETDTAICCQGDEILVGRDEAIGFPTVGELDVSPEQCTYLFSLGGQRYFLVEREALTSLPESRLFIPVQQLRYGTPRHLCFAGVAAHHLYRWYASRKYCGCCSAQMQHDSQERAMVCGECGHREYPQIMPAVIVGVVDGDRLLLTKYAGRENPRPALVAGYAEVGETLEQAVEREVMEETGLKVKHITYYKSQPWPFTGSMLAGFYAHVDGGNTVIRDERELSEAIFVSRADIDVPHMGVAMTNEMICRFKDLGPDVLVCDDPVRQRIYD